MVVVFFKLEMYITKNENDSRRPVAMTTKQLSGAIQFYQFPSQLSNNLSSDFL